MRVQWLAALLGVLASKDFASQVLADVPAYVNDYGYDREAHGIHPVQVYKSTDVVVPHLNLLQRDTACESSLYTLMTPRGQATREAQATILDHNGHLIWTTRWHDQQLYNLMVQEYRGDNYLTFWAGNDAVGGHGAGFYYMLDKFYNEFKKVGAANGLDGDLHDFRITQDGTALITVYQIVPVDLTIVGKAADGPVWDCLIQEIDLETGEAIFEWRALDHYNVTDSYRDVGGDGEGDRAWDFFHMNSIDKDSKGNYLASARYTHSLTYINGSTGEIIWILGGKRNMFNDLSGGSATDFAYQHDARWSDNETTITMFDNGVDDFHPTIATTRGLRVRLDEEAMTVALAAQYINPQNIHGISQGSCQTLPNGNTILGYGNTAAFTEFAHDGTVLCDTHFAPQSGFGKGAVQSYRVYKYDWVGWPAEPPAAVIAQDSTDDWAFYVSWNGATEVSTWLLQGSEKSNGTDHDWVDLDTVYKEEFETEFTLRKWYPTYLRAVAKDSTGIVLGSTDPLDFNSTNRLWKPQTLRVEEDEDFAIRTLVIFCGVLSLGMLLQIARSAWHS
ncbi:ASST-domain-containing protein [Pseudomassariella vexata]|uniref:ASST-domain-containing protein n=1 Tax=Pseudomassariella vexata TaxID=1141098 RepID=A0A1Y2DS83_9PEZI|nr:ASST-domain-containing protein [Pseudomassariella vexata]ORY62133.1 ASST-domain-containing protein [Pseudomassariella vexata]